jgi:hypothetical protein
MHHRAHEHESRGRLFGGGVRASNRSFAEQRLLIELARASKSLDEAAQAIGRKPKAINRMAMRLGISFRPDAEKE